MIKVDLITGFLGSGKTTFLLKYARFLMKQGLKIGIIEYDYGSINVDMLLLGRLRGRQCEIEMVDASCGGENCIERRLRTKLIAMAMSGYDRVLIEPSGVFDVDIFFDMLRDEPLEKWYEIGSVVSVVSANIAKDLSNEEKYFLVSQAADAGSILLSKTQYFTANEIEETKNYIIEIADSLNCHQIKGEFVTKNWDEFTDDDYRKIANSGFYVSSVVKTIAGVKSSFSSVGFLNVKDNLEQFKTKINRLFDDESFGKVLRVKGFIMDNGVSNQVNATPEELLIEPISVGHGEVTVIGKNLNRDKILELINGYNS